MNRLLFLLFLSFSIALTACSREVQAPSAPTNEEILLGANLEMSGKYAQSGDLAAAAINLALQECNDAGGIHGKKVRLIVADNQSSSTGSESAFASLAANKNVLAVIGPSRSSTAIPIGPFADKFQLAFIATIATNPRVTVDDYGKTRPYAFRACFIDPFQGTVIASFARNTLQARNAAILIDQTSDYSKGLATFFQQSFSRLDGQVVYEDGYISGTIDFKNKLKPLLAAKPDLLFIPGFEIDSAYIIAQARSLGFKGPIVGGDGWEPSTMFNLIDYKLLNNTYYCSDTSPADTAPAMQDFVARFKQYSGGKEPQQGTVLAYDATGIALNALKTATSLERKSVRDALEQTSQLPAISGHITLDEKHNAAKSAVMIELSNKSEIFKIRVTP